jgi:FkbM family methyltransferase
MTGGGKLRLRGRSRRLLQRILGGGQPGNPAHLGGGMVSYSQQGEDMILQCLFQGQRTGFYVDVGAHHPAHYSNTYLFYLRGWRGINIDAMPGSMEVFRATRPEDVNLEYAIAETRSTRTYYLFDDPAVNGFSRALSEARDSAGRFRMIGTREIPTFTLAEVLGAHLPSGRRIDFLNVDVEGLDLEVLRSNDWSKYRPRAVVTEDTDAHLIDDVDRSRVVRYLRDQGFRPCAKCVHSIVKVDGLQFEPRQDGFFPAGRTGGPW